MKKKYIHAEIDIQTMLSEDIMSLSVSQNEQANDDGEDIGAMFL